MIRSRSPVTRQVVAAATPLVVLVATYLLFAGHNRPGGGFAAGLVLGALVALRLVVGLSAPSRPVPLLAGGAALAAFVALSPMLWGDAVLDMIVLETEVPLLGKVKSGSALPFDIGVTAVVVGLVITVTTELSPDAELASRSVGGRR